MQALRGTGVAIVTPFLADGSLDLSGLDRLVEYQIQGGIDYLVILGTTGESVTLSKEEKKEVVARVIATNAGRLPLVLGVGGNNTADIVAQLKALDPKPITAILSVSPAYNKPTQEGIYQHFKAVSEASPLPVILYNVPGRTASNMLPDTVARLAKDFDNLVAIKEAANDLVQAMDVIRKTPDDFMVISGDDMIALPIALAGGAGVISVVAACVPKTFTRMMRLGLEGKAQEAYSLQYRLTDLMDLAFAEGNPAGIKSALETKGVCGSMVRLPLVPASPNLASSIASQISDLD